MNCFCVSPSSFSTYPFLSSLASFLLSGLNLNSNNSVSDTCTSCPCIFFISGLFIIVVIKHNFIFSSDISFDITSTFFLCTNAVNAAISIVSLLLPLFEGIAYAIVSPFLIPLNTSVNIGNG